MICKRCGYELRDDAKKCILCDLPCEPEETQQELREDIKEESQNEPPENLNVDLKEEIQEKSTEEFKEEPNEEFQPESNEEATEEFQQYPRENPPQCTPPFNSFPEKKSKKSTISSIIFSIIIIIAFGLYRMTDGFTDFTDLFGNKDSSGMKTDKTVELSGEILTGDGWSMEVVKGWIIDERGDLKASNKMDNITVTSEKVSAEMTLEEFNENAKKKLTDMYDGYKFLSEGDYKVGDYDGYYMKSKTNEYTRTVYFVIKDGAAYSIVNWSWKNPYIAGVDAMLKTFKIDDPPPVEFLDEKLTGEGWSMKIAKGWKVNKDGDLLAPNKKDRILVRTRGTSEETSEENLKNEVENDDEVDSDDRELISQGTCKVGSYGGIYQKYKFTQDNKEATATFYLIMGDETSYIIAFLEWDEKYTTDVEAMLETFKITESLNSGDNII